MKINLRSIIVIFLLLFATACGNTGQVEDNGSGEDIVALSVTQTLLALGGDEEEETELE